MFTITPAAARQIHQAIQDSAQEGDVLRIAAVKKMDQTIDYKMGFDQATQDDIQITSEGIKVAMAPESVPLLDTTTLDFVEIEAGDLQFVFLNPQDSSYVPPQDN